MKKSTSTPTAIIGRHLRTTSIVITILHLAACGDDHGGGPPDPGVDPAVKAFSGSWTVSTTLLAGIEEGCPDIALDSAVLDLDLVLAAIVDTKCDPGTSDDKHVGRYDITSPGFDTASDSQPGRSRFGAQACSNGPGTAVTFVIGGFYSLPAEGITVEVAPVGPSVFTDTSFTLPLAYAVFSGEPIVSADANVPGEDDDCDGEIDEEDEHVFEDEVDPDAVPVCTGTLMLEGVRSVTASAERLIPLLDSSRFPPVPLVLRAAREE